MQPKFFVPLLIMFCLACVKQKRYSKDELESKLKQTMQNYLYADKQTDSTKVKYDITHLIYFDDSIKNDYVCEFTVHMHIVKNNFDTTGLMKATISRDFSKVDRY